MSTPFLAELKIVSFNFAPRGWAMANGQLLPINQNQALFALLGTTYGGNGQTTFALPNLQGRVPIHFGNGYSQGQTGGETAHTLNIGEMPAHSHTLMGSSAPANSKSPAAPSNAWAVSSTAQPYSSNPPSAGVISIGAAGGGQPHDNMSPYLVLTMVIALQGIFPSRS
ncbi:MAG: tail collar protein [Phycisphaerales bacterium]|nr:tail collar protein [Phycisphaerales bacterium]MDB5305393.1 tail collar protein [Phycisphaerales bacterium]